MMRVLLVCSITFLLMAPVSASATSSIPIAGFVGTDLRYHIGFLWLDRVADGMFTFERESESNIYLARLVGKTRGVTAWLTNDRIQSYETRMQLLPDGRLQTLTHESKIDKGTGKNKKIRRKLYRFDLESRQVVIEKHGDGKVMWSKTIELEGEELPVDILTAFFNFASEVYGPIEVGRRYDVKAFSGEGIGLIRIEVVTGRDAPGSFFADNAILCRAQVDQEIFDTRDGVIYFELDTDHRPLRGLIMDIIGLGDIRAEKQ